MSEEIDIKSNRRNLVILFSIGFVPLVFSWVVFFYFPELMPSTTTNEGQLISPPVQASELGLGSDFGKWTLLVPVSGDCSEDCEQRFYLARQVNIALGKESDRVQRMLIDVGAETGALIRLAEEFPEQAVAKVPSDAFRRLLKDEAAIYLMDPVGNVFMVYSKEKAGKPMLKDIKHLLKISNLG